MTELTILVLWPSSGRFAGKSWHSIFISAALQHCWYDNGLGKIPANAYTFPPLNTANMPNASPNDALTSVAADQLALLEVTDSQANTKSSDTSADDTAPPSEEGIVSFLAKYGLEMKDLEQIAKLKGVKVDETSSVLDPELWKPHLPNEDCPLCFVPLPVNETEYAYFVCCGRTLCSACVAETIRAGEIINKKRAKKKQPPIDHTCSFCRTKPDTTGSKYEERIRKGDGRAACNLALKYRDGEDSMSILKNEAKSLELFHHAADDLGDSTAMGELGRMYWYGEDGVETDETKGRKYAENAVKMGNAHARYFLGCIKAEEGNIVLAIRHWKLASAAGEEYSVQKLWEFFYKGALGKAELEKSLRAHKEAYDVVSGEARERRKLLRKAMDTENDDNDVVLSRFLALYYKGDIDAKQLKAAMKLHKEQPELNAAMIEELWRISS